MKYSKLAFLGGTLTVFMAALAIAIFSPSHGVGTIKASDITLEDKFSQFIDSQNQLIGVLQKAIELPKVPVVNSILPLGASVPQCWEDYESWNSSVNYKTSNWDPNFAQLIRSASNFTIPSIFTDLNGDGLTDYLHVDPAGATFKSCVFLNNGHGWDRVFKCYAASQNGAFIYHGDCAA